MTKKVCSLIAAASLSTMLTPALAQEIPASAVSCHFVARVYFNFTTTPPTATVAGYITDIPGIGDPNKGEDSLFSDTNEPSEQNAILTFAADTVILGGVLANGAAQPFQVDSGHFNIYYTAKPSGRNWNDPTTFSAGHKITGIDPAAAVNLQRDQSLAFETDTLIKHDVTEHVISSKPFTLLPSGKTYDLAKFFPAGSRCTKLTVPSLLEHPTAGPMGCFLVPAIVPPSPPPQLRTRTNNNNVT